MDECKPLNIVFDQQITDHLYEASEYLKQRPKAPKNLSLDSQDGGDFTVSWDAVPDADYNIYISEAGGAFVKDNSDLIETTSYNFSDIDPGDAIIYVTAVFNDIESLDSDTLTVEVPFIYIMDLSGDTIGQPPAGITQRYGSGDQVLVASDADGRHLELDRSGAGFNGFAIDFLDDAGADFKGFLKMKNKSNTSGSVVFFGRGSDSALTLYTLGVWSNYSSFFGQNRTILECTKYLNGGLTNLVATGSYDDPGNTEDNFYFQRVELIGDTLKGKSWTEGESEPSGWDFEVTDSDISSGKYIGIGSLLSDDWKLYEFEIEVL